MIVRETVEVDLPRAANTQDKTVQGPVMLTMDKDAKVGSGPQISLLVEFEEISNVGLLALGRIVVYKRGVAVFLD